MDSDVNTQLTEQIEERSIRWLLEESGYKWHYDARDRSLLLTANDELHEYLMAAGDTT